MAEKLPGSHLYNPPRPYRSLTSSERRQLKQEFVQKRVAELLDLLEESSRKQIQIELSEMKPFEHHMNVLANFMMHWRERVKEDFSILETIVSEDDEDREDDSHMKPEDRMVNAANSDELENMFGKKLPAWLLRPLPEETGGKNLFEHYRDLINAAIYLSLNNAHPLIAQANSEFSTITMLENMNDYWDRKIDNSGSDKTL